MVKKGRPTRSIIRDNLINLIKTNPGLAGYDYFKLYLSYYPKCTLRSIYYHLDKAVSLGDLTYSVDETKRSISGQNKIYSPGSSVTPKDVGLLRASKLPGSQDT